MSNSQLSPSNLERPTSNNGSQTPWSTHSAVVKRGGHDSVVCVHPLWEIDLCDHSCCIRQYIFVRVQTWTNTMRRHELVLRELMQHQLLRFGCWSTGTHNSEQKSLRVEWATLEFVPKWFINSPSLRKELWNPLMSEGRNFNVFGQFKLSGQWGR